MQVHNNEIRTTTTKIVVLSALWRSPQRQKSIPVTAAGLIPPLHSALLGFHYSIAAVEVVLQKRHLVYSVLISLFYCFFLSSSV